MGILRLLAVFLFLADPGAQALDTDLSSGSGSGSGVSEVVEAYVEGISSSGSGSGSGEQDAGWIESSSEDDDGFDHADTPVMMYNVISQPEVAPQTMDGEVAPEMSTLDDGGAVVSLSNEFVIKDNDSIGTITRPADWYKLISSVGDETMVSFDTTKQASFKTALTSLINIERKDIILLVMPGSALTMDQPSVNDGVKVHVAFAVPVDDFTSSEIEAMVLGADFPGQLTDSLAQQGIAMTDASVNKILEEVEVASFDMLFQESSFVDRAYTSQMQQAMQKETVHHTEVASVFAGFGMVVGGVGAAAFMLLVVAWKLRVESLGMGLEGEEESAGGGELHMRDRSEREAGGAPASPRATAAQRVVAV